MLLIVIEIKISDHNKINEMYFKDLEDLRNSIQIYQRILNKLVRVYAILASDIMDRPKIRKMTRILRYSGKWSKL